MCCPEAYRAGCSMKHRPRKQAVPRLLRHDADRQPVVGIGPGEAVLDIERLAVERRHRLGVEGVERRSVDGPVYGAPPDVVLGRRLPHQELVVGRASGMRHGDAHERAGLGNGSLIATDRLLVEGCSAEVPVRSVQGSRAEGGARNYQASARHKAATITAPRLRQVKHPRSAVGGGVRPGKRSTPRPCGAHATILVHDGPRYRHFHSRPSHPRTAHSSTRERKPPWFRVRAARQPRLPAAQAA